MSDPKTSDVNLPDTSSQDAAVATAWRRGADVSGDSRAVLEIIRDADGSTDRPLDRVVP